MCLQYLEMGKIKTVSDELYYVISLLKTKAKSYGFWSGMHVGCNLLSIRL